MYIAQHDSKSEQQAVGDIVYIRKKEAKTQHTLNGSKAKTIQFVGYRHGV